jgi:hypothetical protein
MMSDPKCNPHPKAPHGFNRNGSHSAGRYVCECEHWEPYAAGYQQGLQDGLERAYALQEISDIGQLQEAPPRREPLTDEQLDTVRQWFNCIQDTNGGYLAPHDYVLAKEIYERLGMRVPSSVETGIGVKP